MSAQAVTTAYRARTLALRAETLRDLLRIWPAFNPSDSGAYRGWEVGVATIIRRDFQRQSALAAAYLKAHAQASGTTPGQIRPATSLPAEQVGTSLRVTSLAAYGKARAAGKLPDQALDIALVRSSGAATRLALTGGRSVILNTTTQDRRYAGWQRTGNPQCDFCKLLIGRGAVYKEATATFDAHDHCGCSAEPAYR